MALAKQIVIKSEFTIRQNGKGTRGSTPGQYVTQYMSRHDATDVYLPLHDDSIPARFQLYLERDALAERRDDGYTPLETPDPFQTKRMIRVTDGLSGRAFGSSGLSLSDAVLSRDADRIQRAFDTGHAVQKIVLSFEEDYLREQGVLSTDFVYKGRGSYQGAVDQLKLRSAVRSGMSDVSRAGGFSSPLYVATIQVDTAHIHAHIAMVDETFSRKRRRYDGAERGLLYQKELDALRVGVHRDLEASRQLHPFTVQTVTDQQQVKTLVKDRMYDHVKDTTSVQLLMAALPPDDTLWSTQEKRPVMTYPNELARRLVRQIQEGAGARVYKEAVATLDASVEALRVLRNLDAQEVRAYKQVGLDRIDERAVNRLYDELRLIPESERFVTTPLLSVQSRDDQELLRLMDVADDDDLTTTRFALRLRHYGARLDDHKALSRSFYNEGRAYDKAEANGQTDATSMVMRRYYEEEQRYHMGVTDKYRQFLSFHDRINPDDEASLRHMYTDLTDRFQVRDTFTKADDALYREHLHLYAYACFEKGFGSLVTYESQVAYERDGAVTGRMVVPIEPKHWRFNHTPKGIDRVNAFDLHDVLLDFHQMDKTVSEQAILDYHTVYYGRVEAWERARQYVLDTKQDQPLLSVTERELRRMDETARYVRDNGALPSIMTSNQSALFPRNEKSISVDAMYPIADVVAHAITEERMEEEVRRKRYAERASEVVQVAHVSVQEQDDTLDV